MDQSAPGEPQHRQHLASALKLPSELSLQQPIGSTGTKAPAPWANPETVNGLETSTNLQPFSPPGPQCNASVDLIGTCWPRSAVGQLVARPCPEYFYGVRYNTTSKLGSTTGDRVGKGWGVETRRHK